MLRTNKGTFSLTHQYINTFYNTYRTATVERNLRFRRRASGCCEHGDELSGCINLGNLFLTTWGTGSSSRKPLHAVFMQSIK